MARIIDMEAAPYWRRRHLYWKGDGRTFVTLCDDGSVILDGHVMTLAQATSIILKRKGVSPRFFWE